MSSILAIDGDITDEQADALITLVNPYGAWNGGVDNTIFGKAGFYFHNQLTMVDKLYNGVAHVARGDFYQHNGAFQHVIFVIDDLNSPLPTENLAYVAFHTAHKNGFQKVVIPLFRDGKARNIVNVSQQEIAQSISSALNRLDVENGGQLEVKVVIWGDPELTKQLNQPGWLLPG